MNLKILARKMFCWNNVANEKRSANNNGKIVANPIIEYITNKHKFLTRAIVLLLLVFISNMLMYTNLFIAMRQTEKVRIALYANEESVDMPKLYTDPMQLATFQYDFSKNWLVFVYVNDVSTERRTSGRLSVWVCVSFSFSRPTYAVFNFTNVSVQINIHYGACWKFY